MPTITVRLFDYETLKSKLKPDDRIVVLSCDGCARQSDGLGGEGGMEGLAGKLSADGFRVVHRELLPIACSPDQLSDRLQEEPVRQRFDQADVLIALACRAGEERASEALPELRMMRVTETIGRGTYSPEDGARLTEPAEGVGIAVDTPEGISLEEAAKQLGLQAGSF